MNTCLRVQNHELDGIGQNPFSDTVYDHIGNCLPRLIAIRVWWCLRFCNESVSQSDWVFDFLDGFINLYRMKKNNVMRKIKKREKP